MALLSCLAEVLKRERVPDIAFRHPPAYTAQERAAVSHIPGRPVQRPARRRPHP